MTYMKSSAGTSKRAYRMTARAQAADETAQRILRATVELHTELYADQITLDTIAERAGVTVQTVLRHFGSKPQLLQAVTEHVNTQVREQRWQAPVADVAGAVENLLDHYEERGPTVLRLLAQEDRVPEFRPILQRGRAGHREWVRRTFSAVVDDHPDPSAALTQIAVLTDVYVWKLLQLDAGHDRETTAALLVDMIEAVVHDRRDR